MTPALAELLAGLLAISQAALLAGITVFLRVGAAMALLPAFGERSIPARVRLVLSLAFTLIVAPSVVARFPELTEGPPGPLYFVTEAIAGLAIGAAVRLFVLTLQIAGSMAAQSVSLSQIFGGTSFDPQPAIGNVLVIAGLALAVMAGLHVKLAGLLILSYDLIPPGRFPGAEDLAQWGIARIAQAFSLGFTLAAPFVVISLVYNLALGVINRAMPQLMVSFVGAPAITAGGLVLLAVATPLILQVWLAAMDRFIAAPLAVLP